MELVSTIEISGEEREIADAYAREQCAAHTSDKVIHITSDERDNWNAAITNATKVEKSSINGNVLINGIETTVYTHPSGTNPHGTTKSDVGLGNVGNFKAVSTVASQGLTDTEKSNARTNIGAGTSSFSGSYNDLSNKPTIPTVGNGTVTIKQAGTSKGTFTMNQSGNTTIELTDNNTTYGVATSSTPGLVKSGTDITVDSSGNVSVNDDSHNHVISNVDGLQSALDGKAASSHTHSYLSNSNPTGTGSFSLNRKSGSTVGDYSFAEGSTTTASGMYSHAEGFSTSAQGVSSHAEGNSMAIGDCSHAEGSSTAAGDYSHAEGYETEVSGTSRGSHSEGCYTIASGDYQHVQGKYNIEDETSAFIIGNGTNINSRSNAMTVDWNGNLKTAGDITNGSGISLNSLNSNLNSVLHPSSIILLGSLKAGQNINIDLTQYTYVLLNGVENKVIPVAILTVNTYFSVNISRVVSSSYFSHQFVTVTPSTIKYNSEYRSGWGDDLNIIEIYGVK